MRAILPEPSEHPFVDTGVLFDFLVWRFCKETETSFPGCLPDNSAMIDCMKALHWYFDRHKPIHTSPHVIAEIHGLVKARAKWKEPRVSTFWQFAQEELARFRLEEHLVELAKMNREDLGAFGPTDVSVLELAVQEGRTVILEDGALSRRLTQEQIRVLTRWDVLMVWNESTA
jgi:hypothetical protein